MSGADRARITIAPLYLLAGAIHLLRPDVFVRVMPAAIPQPHLVVLLTGAAEVAGHRQPVLGLAHHREQGRPPRRLVGVQDLQLLGRRPAVDLGADVGLEL